jgi:hypothetical protein
MHFKTRLTCSRLLPFICLLTAGTLYPGRVLGQITPLDNEFEINDYTTGGQSLPLVHMAADGSFVATWSGSRPQDDSGIYARRYTGAGQPEGPSFLVNSTTAGVQCCAAVSGTADGSFVVYWSSRGVPGGDGYESLIRRYDTSGVPLGGELQVNTYTTGNQAFGSIDSARDGSFVVVWNGTGEGDVDGVFGRRYDGQGTALGGEFRVNTYTTDRQVYPAVSHAPDGSFVVVWQSYGGPDGDGSAARGQRYDNLGRALGGEFQINTYTTGNQGYVRLDHAGDGSFVVVWHGSVGHDGSSYGVFARRFASDGQARGDEFQVNTLTTSYQRAPNIHVQLDGSFAVVWSSAARGNGGDDIALKLYDGRGEAVGSELQVNTYSTGFQGYPKVAANSRGQFVVVWESSDGDGYGIFGRRFQGPAVVLSADPPRAPGMAVLLGLLLGGVLLLRLTLPGRRARG